MIHKYFIHEWLLDTERVKKYRLILADLISTGDKLNIRFVTATKDEEQNGLMYMLFLIAVPSLQALEEFSSVAQNWGFHEWKEIPENHELTLILKSPNYEKIAPYRINESTDLRLVSGNIEVLWGYAVKNETRMNTLRIDKESNEHNQNET